MCRNIREECEPEKQCLQNECVDTLQNLRRGFLEERARMHAEHVSVCNDYERRLHDVRAMLDEANMKEKARAADDWYTASDGNQGNPGVVHRDSKVFGMNTNPVDIPASK